MNRLIYLNSAGFHLGHSHKCSTVKEFIPDENGNISMENEAFLLEQYDMAAATHNSGGLVLVQVDRMVPAQTMNAKDVVVQADQTLGRVQLARNVKGHFFRTAAR